MLNKLRKTVRAVRAISTGDHPTRLGRLYELMDPTVQFADRATRYVNIGYWQDGASTVDEAGEALAGKLAEIAGFSPDATILDVGCGYGEQDFAWLREGQIAKAYGLDVTPRHIEGARRRARDEGLEDGTDFRVGSATDLPFPAGMFDHVVALDSAHHFYTRSAFFAEAYRVLRPGGVLTTMDTIPLSGDTPRSGFQSSQFSFYKASVPDENWYDREVYDAKLTEAGFVNQSVTSIRDRTWEGWYRYWSDTTSHRPNPAESTKRAVRIGNDEERRLIRQELNLLDFVAAVAYKPATAQRPT